jgi:polysaccharide pyruvyl transferase WcaK-like protein
MKIQNCYMWGWHGQKNFGDDVFAVVSAWALRKYLQAGSVYLDSDVSSQLSQYGISACLTGNHGIPFWGRFRRLVARQKSSLLVLAGGNLLPNSGQVRSLLNDVYWRQNGRRSIAIGVSVGPFQDEKHDSLTAELLSQFSFISFRDNDSYLWAKKVGLSVPIATCCDMAVLLPDVMKPEEATRKSNRTIGVSLLSHHIGGQIGDDSSMEWIFELASETSQAAIRNNCDLKVFALCTNSAFDDSKICEKFIAATNGKAKLILHTGDPLMTYREIQSCSVFVSMRLHGAVMAFCAGIPFLSLSYHPKCQQFTKYVGGDPLSCIELNDFRSNEYRERLGFLLSGGLTAPKLSMADARTSALGGFTRAAELLEHGAGS